MRWLNIEKLELDFTEKLAYCLKNTYPSTPIVKVEEGFSGFEHNDKKYELDKYIVKAYMVQDDNKTNFIEELEGVCLRSMFKSAMYNIVKFYAPEVVGYKSVKISITEHKNEDKYAEVPINYIKRTADIADIIKDSYVMIRVTIRITKPAEPEAGVKFYSVKEGQQKGG